MALSLLKKRKGMGSSDERKRDGWLFYLPDEILLNIFQYVSGPPRKWVHGRYTDFTHDNPRKDAWNLCRAHPRFRRIFLSPEIKYILPDQRLQIEQMKWRGWEYSVICSKCRDKHYEPWELKCKT